MKQKKKIKAADLLKKYNLHPPIPVEKLAKKMGVTVSYGPLDEDISGFLFRKEDEIIIGVNSFHPRTRQRFTIAHEIAHFLNHQGDFFVDRKIMFRDAKSQEGTDENEKEANSFAAELLMPEDEVLEGLSKTEIEDEEEFRAFVDEFGVSVQAMTIRIKNLLNSW